MAKATEVVVDVSEELEGTEVAAAGVGVYSGSLGSGQVMSIHSSGQVSYFIEEIPLPGRRKSQWHDALWWVGGIWTPVIFEEFHGDFWGIRLVTLVIC